jgi:hypothetical protein
MFEPCSDRESQPLGNDDNFVLKKGTKKLICFTGRIEGDSDRASNVIGRDAIPETPYKILPISPGDVMLKINVEGVAALSIGRVTAIGTIEINLESRI